MIRLHLSQQEIYFDQVLDPESTQYNIGTYVTIKGGLDVSLFKRSIASSQQAFDVFRFHAFPKDIAAIDVRETAESVRITDLDFSGPEWTDEACKRWLRERIHTPFDIHSGKLYDFVLIKREQEYWFYVACHHLFCDGYGLPYIFLSYVFDKYHALRTQSGQEFYYPPYIPCIERSNTYLYSEAYEADRKYWQERFRVSQEPLIQERTGAGSFRTNAVQLLLNRKEQETLRAFCVKEEISLQDFLVALLTVYYKKVNNTERFDFCLPVHNRNDRRERQTLGAFSKILPCRIEAGAMSLRELFGQIKQNQRQDYRHKQFPLSHFNKMLREEIVNASQPFDICVNYRYFRLETAETELELKGFRNDAAFSRIPIEFSWCDFAENGREELFLEITYREDYFDQEEIELLKKRIAFIIEQFYTQSSADIGSINILPEKERGKLLIDFNSTAAAYPQDQTLLDLFAQQVKRSADQAAVLFEDRKLSYKELDQLSNQLARYLKKNYSIGQETCVGVKLARTEWMIVAVLGILKAGAAYVPIDPEYPVERIAYMEQDTACKICLDEKELHKFIATQKIYATTKVAASVKPADLAYVIYTSGSTGKPKGVMIEHRNVYAFIKWSHDEFRNSGFETLLFTTSLNFDLSVFEIFYALTSGKELRVLKDGLAIPAFANSEKKLLINTVPSVVGALLQQGMSFASVSVLNMAGEPVPRKYRDQLKGRIKEIRNLYGPSEDTTYSTMFRIDKDGRDLIGVPISNTRVYIVNEQGALQPIGTVGEICLAGAGLARGYLNQEALTQSKFVSNPFEPGGRMYKTGDLGRWLPDGTLAFIGRKDNQVKIRGFRIEPGEIEYVLQSHRAVKDAVVVASRSNASGQELAAYFTAREPLGTEELRAWLTQRLPAYMLPARFIQLETLPLTSNGKIDKKALPDPEGFVASGNEYQAPVGEIEEQLCKIWEEVLLRTQIGVNNDFFALGGHSLKVTQLISEYHKAFDVKLSLIELFNHPTIVSQARLIAAAGKKKFEPIEKVPEQENYPLSDAQRRLWVLSQFEEGSLAYNMPGSLELNGVYEPALFQKAFDSLIERHESLRTVFREDERGEIRQWIVSREALNFRITYKDLRHKAERDELVKACIKDDTYKVFDLERGPLLRASLIRKEEEQYVLLFNMHHIVGDGWSLHILSRDLFSFYESYKNNRPPELKVLNIQYKDYAAWQQRQIKRSFAEHRSYWLQHLAGELPLLDLPSARQRPKIKTSRGRAISTCLDAELTMRLRAYSEASGGSLFMSLLAAWNVLMYRYTSSRDIITGTAVAGREHRDLCEQIGFYINLLPLRSQIEPEESFDTFYRRMRDETLESYSHQLYPFDKLVEELQLNRDTSRNAVFDVMLILHNNESLIPAGDLHTGSSALIRDLGECTSKFDLELSAKETENGLLLHMIYNPDIYDVELPEHLIRHYRQLLYAILENPGQTLSKIDFLSEQEMQELLTTFNNTSVAPAGDKTLVDLFTIQAEKKPGHVAVLFGETQLSYCELNERSDRLAVYLQTQYGIKPGDLVGIRQERDEWMIISLLAVMKSGAAYVPVDPDYPQERRDYIERDTQLRISIDEQELQRFGNVQEQYAGKRPVSSATSRDLAYILYTSGSTGKPKGVMIEQAAIVSFISNFDLGNAKRIAGSTPLSFDIAGLEIWGALCLGKTLVLLSKEELSDPYKYIEQIRNSEVDCLQLTPARLLQIYSAAGLFPSCVSLVLVGGEALPAHLYERLRTERFKVVHVYGPTETTIWSTSLVISGSKQVNIGKPLPGEQVYILNEAMQLQPVGVIGEICISGYGLARGYLNQEVLSREKFVAHPFRKDTRVYRTGDLGRWLPDGSIEFSGRKDEQVKIRGYRIEPAEIEQALCSYSQVETAVVTLWYNQDKDKELIAYVVAKRTLTADELRHYLKAKLPEYMLPSRFIQLEKLPLNSSGKVDRKRLPEPEGVGLSTGVEYVAPRNETEQLLVRIWTKALQREKIGVRDDFFSLGGHSLKAITIIKLINREFSVRIEIREMFDRPTIESMSELIKREVWIRQATQKKETLPVNNDKSFVL